MQRFSMPVIALLRDRRILRVRAGLEPHRFLPIWVVLVGDRAFVRPWNDKPAGWYRAFLDEPRGAIQIAEREVPVRTRKIRGERLLDDIDAAYARKYPTRGSSKFVIGFARPRRRATTLELLPRSG